MVIRPGHLEGTVRLPRGSRRRCRTPAKCIVDGSLEVLAQGNTGKREYAVGRVDEGTAYAYTLHGKLGDTSEQPTQVVEIEQATVTVS